MEKETQKAKIERLEKENTELKQALANANKEIQKLKNEDYTLEDIKGLENRIQNARKTSDKWHKEYFDKDMQYKELNKKYDELEKKYNKLKAKNRKLELNSEVLKEVLKEVKQLKIENEELKNSCIKPIITKVHNERGAGRKSKFKDADIKQIKEYRSAGKTIKEISIIYGCSVGLIHKLISEK